MPRAGRKKFHHGTADKGKDLIPSRDDSLTRRSHCHAFSGDNSSPSPSTPPKIKKTPTKQDLVSSKITHYFSPELRLLKSAGKNVVGSQKKFEVPVTLNNSSQGVEEKVPLPDENEIVYATADELEEDGCSGCEDSGSGKENEDWRASRMDSRPATTTAASSSHSEQLGTNSMAVCPKDALGRTNERDGAVNSAANSSSSSPLQPRRATTRSRTARFNLESPTKKNQLADSLSRLSKVPQQTSSPVSASPLSALLNGADVVGTSTPTRSDTSIRTPPNSPPTPHKIKLVEEKQGRGNRAAGDALYSSSSSVTVSSEVVPNGSVNGLIRSPKKASKDEDELVAKTTGCRRNLTEVLDTGSDGHSVEEINSQKKAGVQNGNLTKNEKAKQRLGGKSKAVPHETNGGSKVTDFFPIRRSERKPKKEIAAKQQLEIESFLTTTVSTDDGNLGIGIKWYDGKGRGIEARKKFSKGDFVVEYAGDLMEGMAAAKFKEEKYASDAATGCYMYYFKHGDKHYCIDATAESGRLGRLVNHSRLKPNCQTKVVVLKDAPRLILVAKTDIEPGTELLYDYGDRSKESLKAHPWLAL